MKGSILFRFFFKASFVSNVFLRNFPQEIRARSDRIDLLAHGAMFDCCVALNTVRYITYYVREKNGNWDELLSGIQPKRHLKSINVYSLSLQISLTIST